MMGVCCSLLQHMMNVGYKEWWRTSMHALLVRRGRFWKLLSEGCIEELANGVAPACHVVQVLACTPPHRAKEYCSTSFVYCSMCTPDKWTQQTLVVGVNHCVKETTSTHVNL